MRILCIGNSFSNDATSYLNRIAKRGGADVNVINLYIPGCPIDSHYRNMLSEAKNYQLEVNGFFTPFKVSLKEALLAEHWDVITIQQASAKSFRLETYYPFVKELFDYVKKCAPAAKIVLHQTWAYEDGSEKLEKLAGFTKSSDMLNAIKETYGKVYEDLAFDGMIPSGEMFGALLDAGIPKIHRDTFHASYGLGRYALGMLWFRLLTGKSVLNNDFSEYAEPIPAEHIKIVKEYVEAQAPLFRK